MAWRQDLFKIFTPRRKDAMWLFVGWNVSLLASGGFKGVILAFKPQLRVLAFFASWRVKSSKFLSCWHWL